MAKRKKRNKLTDADVDEVSFVTKPAFSREGVPQTFLFFKSEDGTFEKKHADIQLKSDGTVQGTEITINGKSISPLEFNFSMFAPTDITDDTPTLPVFARYTVASKGESGGFSSTKTFILSETRKTEKTDSGEVEYEQPDVEDLETIQKYVGAEEEIAMSKTVASKFSASLNVLGEYYAEFPADVRQAIESISKIAVAGQIDEEDVITIEKSDKETEEKTVSEEGKKDEKTTEEASTETSAIENLTVEVSAWDILAGKVTEKVTEKVIEALKPMLEGLEKRPEDKPAGEKESEEKPAEDDTEEVDVSEDELLEMVNEELKGNKE